MLSFLLAQNDDRVKDVLMKTRSNPHRRLQYIYDLAKSKTMCEGGDTVDAKLFDQPATEDPTKPVRTKSFCNVFSFTLKISYANNLWCVFFSLFLASE